jgi:hypothetical protein
MQFSNLFFGQSSCTGARSLLVGCLQYVVSFVRMRLYQDVCVPIESRSEFLSKSRDCELPLRRHASPQKWQQSSLLLIVRAPAMRLCAFSIPDNPWERPPSVSAAAAACVSSSLPSFFGAPLRFCASRRVYRLVGRQKRFFINTIMETVSFRLGRRFLVVAITFRCPLSLLARVCACLLLIGSK